MIGLVKFKQKLLLYLQCTFKQGDQVLVRDYRAQQEKWLPGAIQYENGPVTYGVNVNGAIWKRHVDQLRQNWSQKSGRSTTKMDSSQDVEQEVAHLPTSVEVLHKAHNKECLNDQANQRQPTEDLRRSTRVPVRPRRLIEEM